MPSFRVRAATLHDLDTLVLHRRRMWEDLGERDSDALDAADTLYRRWAGQKLRARRLVGFVAVDGKGRPVASGCVWLRPAQPRPGRPLKPAPYLLSMYTEPAVRGRGLATRIVREAIRWCRAQGYSRLTLHASDQGRGVYGRLGFTRTWEMRLRIPLVEPEVKSKKRRSPVRRRGRRATAERRPSRRSP